MTRVPTTATYKLYMSQMTKQKTALSDMSYQSATGNKYESYNKYGLSTYRILSLQNERAVTTKYLETNSITQVVLESQETSMDGIRSSLVDVRSQIRDFFAHDLTAMSKDPTEEELISLRNVQESAFETMSLIAYYLNTEVDGNYIYGGGKTTVPPVDFPYKSLEEFQAVYDGDIMTYPTSYSAALSEMSSTPETLGGVTIEQEYRTIKKPFDYLAAAGDSLAFSSSSLTADAGTFTGLVAGDRVALTGTDSNDQTLTVTGVSADGSLITFAEPIRNEEIGNSYNVKLTKTYEATPLNRMTFAATSLTAGAGTFTGLVAGEQLTVTGSTTGNNNQTLTVVSVSADGSTVTFSDDPIFNETSSGVRLTNATRNYAASAGNQMTFDHTANTLTADTGTFAGLVAGNQIIVNDPGSANDGRVLTVAQVEDDGTTATVTFVEDILEEASASSTAVLNIVYDASAGNEMSFYDAGAVSADEGTFTGLTAGDAITVADTTGNNMTLTVKTVSADGSTVVFNENNVNNEVSSAANFTKAYKGSPTNAMSFDQSAKILMAQAGTFAGLEKGDEIAVAGTAGNNQTFTIESVSGNGDYLTFKERVSNETVSAGVTINQTNPRINLITEYVGSDSNRMEFSIGLSKLKANAGTFFDSVNNAGLVAGDVVVVTGTDGNDQTLIIHSVSADGSTLEFEYTGTEEITDEVLKDSSAVALTKKYAASSTNPMSFAAAVPAVPGVPGVDANLSAAAGTFTGMAAGDVIKIDAPHTPNHNRELTVSSVSADGSTIYFEENVTTDAGLTTASFTKSYIGSQRNKMTFESPGKLTADQGTFTGLNPGDQVVISGTGGANDQILTVASVQNNGGELRFTTPPAANQTLTTSETVKVQQGKWDFESTFDPTTGITTNSLTGRVGMFSDLEPGKRILIEGTNSNNGFLTVESVSADGSTVYFEEEVDNELLETIDLLNGFASIKQSTQTGKITAAKNIGEEIETLTVTTPITADAVNHTLTGFPGAFEGLTGGQTITLKDSSAFPEEYTLYVKSVSDDGSTIVYSDSDSSSPNVPLSGMMSNVPFSITTHSDISGFVTSSLKGGPLQTGDVSFNLNQNSMTATVKGAFSQYNPGDCLIVKGADSNDKIYIVDSVSEDGRTVKFSDETRVVAEMSQRNGAFLPDGEGLTLCKTYSVGATVDLSGTGNAHNGLYTVLGVSADGKELTVRTEDFPEFGETADFVSAALETETYYQGGYLSTGYRISETAKIANDVNAASGAFEKIFRALGAIAQGNMLDARNPENAEKRVSEALQLLDEVMTVQTKGKNQDITSIQYSVITKMDQVQTTIENQTTMQNSLETYIASLTQVDKTEAVTMLLQASENLKTSYAVLSSMNQLSLLNYL